MSEHTVTSSLATKIVIQQHSRLLRDTLVHWLASLPGYVVVGVTENKVDLTRLCTRSKPDIIVLEIGPESPAVFTRLCGEYQDGELHHAPYLIGLYGKLDVIALPHLRRAGVHRLVSVQSGLGGLHAALQAASTTRRPPVADELLTARELEVLSLICSGWATTRIAAALAISPHTVVNHTRRIFTKLNVRSRTQAAAKAAALGLFGEHPPRPVHNAAVRRLAQGNGDVVGPQPLILVDPTADEWSAAHAQGGDVVVVLSDSSSGSGVAEAVARGADAVLGDESLAEHLPPAMAMVRAGYLVAPAHPVRALLSTAHPTIAAPVLTRRERDILNSVAQGDTVRQTAQSLGIAIKTVQNEQRQLFCRLGVRNRTEALMLARGLGLVDPEYVRSASTDRIAGTIVLSLEASMD